MATPVIRFLIGGLDYTPHIDMESVSVDNNVIMTSDTASFTMTLNNISNTGGFQLEAAIPECGQEFIWQIIDTSNNNAEITREFGGVLVNIDEVQEGASFIYTVSVKSYIHWFDRHLVTKLYNQGFPTGTNTQCHSIDPSNYPTDTAAKTQYQGVVNQIVAQYCPGFTTNHVTAPVKGITVVPQYFNYQKPSECFRVLLDQLEWGWYIDYWKDIHAYPFESEISPLPGNYLYPETDTNSYGDLTLSQNGEQVYNRIFLKGFKARSTDAMVLTFPCDGNTTQWSLGYRASSVKNDVQIAVYPSLAAMNADTGFKNTGTVTGGSGGTQLTVKKDIVDGSPTQGLASNTGYIHFTQHLIRVPNPLGSGLLGAPYIVAIWMHYMKDLIYMGQDASAQTITKKIEGSASDGIYEYAHEDKSLTNSTMGAVTAKAQLLLGKYEFPQIKGSFTSFLSGWRAGQYFILSTKRMGGLTTSMYVQRVSKQIINSTTGGYLIQNTIEFADSPYLI